MTAYVDTSVVVALLFGDRSATRALGALGRVKDIWSSALLEAELRSVASREGVRRAAIDAALRPVRWVLPNRRLQPEIEAVLAAGYLRGADLWHLACALSVASRPSTLPFLSLDAAQRQVAAKLGFPVRV